MAMFELTKPEVEKAWTDAKLKVDSMKFPGTDENDNFVGSCGETAFSRWVVRVAVVSSGPCPPLKSGTADFYAGRGMPKLGVDVKTHASQVGLCTYDKAQSANFNAKGIDVVVWAELNSKEYGEVSWTGFTPPIRITLLGWSLTTDILAASTRTQYGKDIHVIDRGRLRALTELEKKLKA